MIKFGDNISYLLECSQVSIGNTVYILSEWSLNLLMVTILTSE